jgi:hypothetical protein
MIASKFNTWSILSVCRKLVLLINDYSDDNNRPKKFHNIYYVYIYVHRSSPGHKPTLACFHVAKPIQHHRCFAVQ